MERTTQELRTTLREVIHRTNNHLGGVVTLTEVLEGTAADENTRHIAERILRACEDLRAYLRQVRRGIQDGEQVE